MSLALVERPVCSKEDSLDRVPVDPFQARFLHLEERGLITRGDVARALGWYRNPPSGRQRAPEKIVDTGRVTRVLGLKATNPQRRVSYDLGVRLCSILGLDPFEAGV